MSYLLWYDAASFSSLLPLLLFIPCSAVYLCYCQCGCVSEAEMYLSRICLCKSYFFRGTCVLTQMAGVMLRTPRWYWEICESVFSLSITVQSKILFIYPEVTVKEVLKKVELSRWHFSSFTPRWKLLSGVSLFNMETFKEGLSHESGKNPWLGSNLPKRHFELICFLFNCPPICVSVCVCVLLFVRDCMCETT